jgi:hypothetical protein
MSRSSSYRQIFAKSNASWSNLGLTLKRFDPMSALPPKADMVPHDRDVRFVPKADIALLIRTTRWHGRTEAAAQ